MRVITNGHRRDVIDAWQLTADERREFDYLDWPAIERGEDSASFFRYRGELHDLGEFTPSSDQPAGGEASLGELGWHAYRSDSFFSALAVRFVNADGDTDGEWDHVVVGLALSD